MASPEDHARFTFHTRFVVPTPVPAVAAVLVDLEHYPSWWPQVRAVAKLDDDHAWVVCRSALPYDLDLVLGAVDRGPQRLLSSIDGDLIGQASWTLAPHWHGTSVDYRQDVVVAGSLRRATRFGAARALMRRNHGHMMSGCERGLRRRLALP